MTKTNIAKLAEQRPKINRRCGASPLLSVYSRLGWFKARRSDNQPIVVSIKIFEGYSVQENTAALENHNPTTGGNALLCDLVRHHHGDTERKEFPAFVWDGMKFDIIGPGRVRGRTEGTGDVISAVMCPYSVESRDPRWCGPQ